VFGVWFYLLYGRNREILRNPRDAQRDESKQTKKELRASQGKRDEGREDDGA
jgi:hypothetical protein